MFTLLIKKDNSPDYNHCLSKAALHLFHTAILVHSKETFKNVTAPLRLPVSHLALFGHTILSGDKSAVTWAAMRMHRNSRNFL